MTLPTQNCDVVIATNTANNAAATTTTIVNNNNHHHHHHHSDTSATPAVGITSMPALADDNNNDIVMQPSSHPEQEEQDKTATLTAAIVNDCNSADEEGSRTAVAATVVASPNDAEDDDSDMFGPPRSLPLRLNKPRVPMISNKLRLREERKRILQLCANKLEKIKDSETNLRRSVCINNTYSRLTDEVRREKQSRYLANLPKCDVKNDHDLENNDRLNGGYHRDEDCHGGVKGKPAMAPRLTVPNQPMSPANHNITNNNNNNHSNSNCNSQYNSNCNHHHHHNHLNSGTCNSNNNSNHLNNCNNYNCDGGGRGGDSGNGVGGGNHFKENYRPSTPINLTPKSRKRSSHVDDTDLETLDREINALDAAMPLIDPEITQGAEQLERALVSRKRTRIDEANDRLVREALSHFYLSPRLLSAIDDCPIVSSSVQQMSPSDAKKPKLMSLSTNGSSCGGGGGVGNGNGSNSAAAFGIGGAGPDTATIVDLDLNLVDTLNHSHQREFEVIMETLRLGSGSSVVAGNGGTSPGQTTDSCGQAAMLSEQGGGVFHNLVVASLET